MVLATVSREESMLNLIKKALSVSGEIDVSELRYAVARHNKMRGFAPPRRVLLTLCGMLSEYRVDGDIVIANPPLKWRDVLSGTEVAIVQVLKKHGGILDGGSIERRCASKGIGRGAFYKYLMHSPAITKCAPGVYRVTGANASPSTIDVPMPQRKRRSLLIDHGWTPDGRMCLGYRLSRSAIETGRVGVPSSMRDLAGGAFSLSSEDGASIGTLECKGRSARGLRQLFRRRGGEVGDYLALVLDTEAREAKAYLGGLALLDRFPVR